MSSALIVCDECGEPVYTKAEGVLIEFLNFGEAPYNGASFSKGESATVCYLCHPVLVDIYDMKPSKR